MRFEIAYQRLQRVALIGAFGLALTGQTDSAFASVFNVAPTKIVLTADQSSTLLTITNDSDKIIRFQLTVFTWDQNDDGSMKLTPTTDIVIYPPMLSLAAKEVRRIRLGTQSPIPAP